MKRKQLFFLLTAGLSLAGCGPIYETRYNYEPPKSHAAMMCVSTCEMSRASCRQMQDMDKQNCEYNAERDYHMCLRSKDEQHKKDCYRRSCYVDYTMCDEQFRSCYQSCGGTVKTYQVCVAFCNGK